MNRFTKLVGKLRDRKLIRFIEKMFAIETLRSQTMFELSVHDRAKATSVFTGKKVLNRLTMLNGSLIMSPFKASLV